MKRENKGIDYGLGQLNVDRSSGIRFGVIPQNELGESWFDSAEAHYGDPHCPKCGNSAVDYSDINDNENAKQNIPPKEEWNTQSMNAPTTAASNASMFSALSLLSPIRHCRFTMTRKAIPQNAGKAGIYSSQNPPITHTRNFAPLVLPGLVICSIP